MPLLRDILEFLRQHEACDTHLLIACSGGPDSAALAHAISVFVKEKKIASAALLHIDHGLRPESGEDARKVEALGATLGLPVIVEKVSVQKGASLEAAARDARYEAFERIAKAQNTGFVLTGHTSSDQSETVLMRITRGTGIQGLAGIPEKRDRYLRPLLRTSRDQVLSYIQLTGIQTLNDSMNNDRRFLRVRVRKDWLPALRAENPNVDEALNRLSNEAKSYDEVVRYSSEVVLRDAERNGGLDVEVLLQAPSAIRRRAVCSWLDGFGLGPIESTHWQSIESLLEEPSAGTSTICVPGGRIHREYGSLTAGNATKPSDVSVRGLAEPFSVRTWKAGDRMKPKRLRGRTKKLSDLFIDAKVPKRIRRSAQVVVNQSGEIVWAEHVGLAFQADFEVNLTTSTSVAINNSGAHLEADYPL